MYGVSSQEAEMLAVKIEHRITWKYLFITYKFKIFKATLIIEDSIKKKLAREWLNNYYRVSQRNN